MLLIGRADRDRKLLSSQNSERCTALIDPMKIPRIILNPSVVGWIRLLQRERKANARLRRELLEWQNRILEKSNVRPLYQAPPKPQVPIERAPIGATQKRLHVARHAGVQNEPTAEQILAQAERAANR